jgi:proton-translocating NADH-quinone oxidoreductase chain L
MYITIVLAPLFGSIISGLGGRWVGREGAVIVSTSGVALSLIYSLYTFLLQGLCGKPIHFDALCWIDSALFHASWGFLFDSLTAVMLVVVTSVSTLVHIYSSSYMGEDPHLPRFMSYLSLFTFFMLILVTADNFIQLFVGWEGVGLCSYLLINFWYSRLQANKAAIKAMLVNRVGDFGLALGIAAIFITFRSVEYEVVFAAASSAVGQKFLLFGVPVDVMNLICILLFVGAVGKSAQLGLHTWLPDAMEGPTPVSALIHAATMVTAGVFLLARCSPLFELAPTALVVVTVVGALTAFMAATTGLLQNDLKRVIAYSTCSQLGYMVFACGLSSYNVAIFHLSNHAFFKALLFLSAGSVIHALADEQDMRRMGGLVRALPFTYAMMVIGSMSLMGFPFLTGFYSKDMILEVAYAQFTWYSQYAHWLGTLAAFFTAFYSFRLLHLTFLGPFRGYRASMEHVHEAPKAMAWPLFILSWGSIFVGYATREMMVSLGTDFWGNAIMVRPEHLAAVDAEFIPSYVKLAPVILSIAGAAYAMRFYTHFQHGLYRLKITKGFVPGPWYSGVNLYRFLNRKWYFDKLYNTYLAQGALHHGYRTTFLAIDRGIIELWGPYGIANTLYSRALNVTRTQTGSLYHYAFTMLIGATSLILVIEIWGRASLDIRLGVIAFLSAVLYNTAGSSN